jgi:hypothetical protein
MYRIQICWRDKLGIHHTWSWPNRDAFKKEFTVSEYDRFNTWCEKIIPDKPETFTFKDGHTTQFWIVY